MDRPAVAVRERSFADVGRSAPDPSSTSDAEHGDGQLHGHPALGAEPSDGCHTRACRGTTRQSRASAPACPRSPGPTRNNRSEEHTSELQSLMRISYAVFCLKKKKTQTTNK